MKGEKVGWASSWVAVWVTLYPEGLDGRIRGKGQKQSPPCLAYGYLRHKRADDIFCHAALSCLVKVQRSRLNNEHPSEEKEQLKFRFHVSIMSDNTES